MLLNLSYALVRLLLANAIGLRMVLSGAVSIGHVVPSLVCNMAECLVQSQMHQFPGKGIRFHCRISCIHQFLLVILPHHIGSGMMYSILILFCLMSVFKVVHIC